jgi:hypothetical protein
MRVHHRIVNELTECGHRSAHGNGVGGTESVTNAEAHAVMLSEMEFHGEVAGGLFVRVVAGV